VRGAWPVVLAIAALATAYYLLLGFVMDHLPWAVIPAWWWHPWPSRHAAVHAWLQALDIVGSLVAAFPIAAIVAVFLKRRPYTIALCAAVGAAAVIIGGILVEYPPWSSPVGPALAIANLVVYFLALAASPVFLLWLAKCLPSNNRWRGP
jgi:hypothetical protein